MHEGNQSRRLSATQDQHIHREMGSRSIDEFVEDRLADAASPEQLEALAFQFLCNGRRCKTHGFKPQGAQWKDAWRRAGELAAAARARLAKVPSVNEAPELYNPRTVGKPGCLDSDLRLPLVARFEIGRPEMMAEIYGPLIRDGVVYRIGGSRLGHTWLTAEDQPGSAIKVRNQMLRGLWNLGMIVPVAAPEMAKAA